MKYLLQDQNGHLTPVKTSLAGLGAGVVESLLAVTPSESIKTSLCVITISPFDLKLIMYRIDDRKSTQPRMKGLVHGAGII